jgi:hypothetical protein
MLTEKNSYHKTLDNGLVVQHMQPEDAGQLEALQKIVFPNITCGTLNYSRKASWWLRMVIK